LLFGGLIRRIGGSEFDLLNLLVGWGDMSSSMVLLLLAEVASSGYTDSIERESCIEEDGIKIESGEGGTLESSIFIYRMQRREDEGVLYLVVCKTEIQY